MFRYKTLAFFLVILLFGSTKLLHAQDASANLKRFYFFKTWAFLKYNHPAIASGQVDAVSK
ncbi:hypothetical protein GCM10011387_22510 [Pedobacter quisquiliarum]|uniref:ABC transporter substrate-binding protein n=1 Tax=Pedobacter quisquiliarum TaxID=1834438 RepID=A0A916UDB2_9SPHI|nr:hypothetical protein [Pedobacter quisquiliarum]GGC68588.1 hypothetical protein GCM10011387_22510 [Pedobacter quisquiliarum]